MEINVIHIILSHNDFFLYVQFHDVLFLYPLQCVCVSSQDLVDSAPHTAPISDMDADTGPVSYHWLWSPGGQLM